MVCFRGTSIFLKVSSTNFTWSIPENIISNVSPATKTTMPISDLYLRPRQKSMIELSFKNSSRLKPLTIFSKNCIIDIWQWLKCASACTEDVTTTSRNFNEKKRKILTGKILNVMLFVCFLMLMFKRIKTLNYLSSMENAKKMNTFILIQI